MEQTKNVLTASSEELEKFRVVGLTEDTVELKSEDASMKLSKGGYLGSVPRSIEDLFNLKFRQQIGLSHERNDSDLNTIEFCLKNINLLQHDVVDAYFELRLDKDNWFDLSITAYKSYFNESKFKNELKVNNKFVFRFVI